MTEREEDEDLKMKTFGNRRREEQSKEDLQLTRFNYLIFKQISLFFLLLREFPFLIPNSIYNFIVKSMK